jgi:hypothetical protein
VGAGTGAECGSKWRGKKTALAISVGTTALAITVATRCEFFA